MAISLESYAQLSWGLQRGIALKLRNTIKMKSEFLFCASSGSFCLTASHISHLLVLTQWLSPFHSGVNINSNNVLYFVSPRK